MKLGTFSLVAVTLVLSSAVFAGNYKVFAGQGYRWVEVLQSSLCYYLIPRTIVQVIKQNPSSSLSQMRIGGVPRPLWAYTRFLSEHAVRDLYGVMETPESSGLLSTGGTNVPPPRSDSSATRTPRNGIPRVL